MMEIKNLIDRLDGWEGVDAIYNGEFVQVNYHGVFRLVEEAAAALEQLQAENDRLKRERDDAIRQLKFFAPCAGCKWYRGIKGCAHELGCDTNHDYYEFVAKEE